MNILCPTERAIAHVLLGRLTRALILWLILFPMGSALAGEDEVQITLNAGNSYSINNIDPGNTFEVHFIKNHPFDVQQVAERQLVILATERGEGTLTFRRNGREVICNIIVNAIAKVGRPLDAGASPPAINDLRFSSTIRSEAVAESVPAKRAGATDSSAALPTDLNREAPAGESPQQRSSAGAGPAASASGETYDYSETSHSEKAAPLMSNQASIQAPAEVRKYITDPSAKLEMSRRPPDRHGLPADNITLMSGTSRVYDFPLGIRRVSVSATHVADVQIIDPHQLMLVGHAPGFATVVVWDTQHNYIERQIRVEHEGEQQVLLHVVVAEVNRTRLDQQGIDFSVALTKYGFSFASLPGMVANAYNSQMNFTTPNGAFTGFLPPGGNYYPLPVSNGITYAIGGSNSNVSTNAFFQFLEDHNLGKILAQPDLVATSGREAKFLSGGEIPIIISQALNTSIVFKQYGTSVIFVPTVVSRRDIELLVKPEVSEPDYTHEVSLNGYIVPAFVTRRAETLVRMRENQTLLIAGLILDTTNSEVKKVPYLGDVPYLGALFRNTYWDHSKTELVMSVTPRMVAPIPVNGQLELPTGHAGPMSPEEIRTRPLVAPDASRPRF
jgi:Flp pilus assembly secretin CpaC